MSVSKKNTNKKSASKKLNAHQRAMQKNRVYRKRPTKKPSQFPLAEKFQAVVDDAFDSYRAASGTWNMASRKALPSKLSTGNLCQIHAASPGVLACLAPRDRRSAEPILYSWSPTAYPRFYEAIQGYFNFLHELPTESYGDIFRRLRRYVLVFAHGHLYKDAPRHALLIRKPAGSPLHAGLYNLPGGKIEEPHETPPLAACREFYEETGWQCDQPQLMGAYLPSIYDLNLSVDLTDPDAVASLRPYIVYCYRAIIQSARGQTATDDAHALNIKAHAPKWFEIASIGSQPCVPNLPCLLSHLAAETRCFIIQDCWTSQNTQPAFPVQEIVTYYLPEFLEEQVAGRSQKQRFTT